MTGGTGRAGADGMLLCSVCLVIGVVAEDASSDGKSQGSAVVRAMYLWLYDDNMAEIFRMIRFLGFGNFRIATG